MLSHVWLFVTSWTICSPPSSSVHGIIQARILEWVAIFYSRGSSQPWDWSLISYIGRCFLYQLSHQGSPIAWDHEHALASVALYRVRRILRGGWCNDYLRLLIKKRLFERWEKADCILQENSKIISSMQYSLSYLKCKFLY